MKTPIKFFVLFLGLGLFLTSCGSTDAAEKTSKKFFKLLISGEIENANKLVATGLDAETQLDQIKMLAEDPTMGKLVKAEKKMGFNTQVNNGITSVKLPYELKYEKQTLNREVTIVNRGAGFKIEAIQ